MSNTDAKKNGRFIKMSDPLRKVLTITDFSLADICESPITFHDNASANIIHEKLHLREELEQSVRLSYEIDTVFPNQEERMLIRPLDFTDEWNRLRKRQSNRTMRSDEDDDFDLEAARAEEAKQDQDDLEALETRNRAKDELIEEKAQGSSIPDAKPHESTPFPTAATSPVMAAPPSFSPTPVPPPQPPPSPSPMVAPQAEVGRSSSDEFVPYASPNQGSQTSTPERSVSDEELEQIRAEAREEGYRQGYQSGEERATMESRQKAQAILEEVVNIVENLEGMQKSILNQAQANFYSICRSFIESMLHKEFTLNPEVFGTVIERAIDEALNDDEFKIFVSPKVAKELKSWSNEKLSARLRPDDALQEHNFRVEGQHASIDAEIPKIIKELLDQADLNLFDANKKVG